MAKEYRWKFKAHFRSQSYGWHGTALASKRLQEAVSEIKKVAKTDSVTAADGAVSLMERLWPSLQNIDTSSGALGNAVGRTLFALIPILINAPADKITREKWLNRLYRAVQEDGVQYLTPVEKSWGSICYYPELANEWADLLLPELAEHWKNEKTFQFFIGIDICLSCLLETERYDDLKDLLSLRTHAFWPYDWFWVEALRRQGRIDEAIAFAESRLKNDKGDFRIMEFCESLLLEVGRREEAYSKYGLLQQPGWTYISQFRSIVKKYPEREPRQILLDLIAISGDKASWFASARQAGFLDIALECAFAGPVNPHTLIRAARDTIETEPEFAAKIALRALDLLVQGYGFEISANDLGEAINFLLRAAEKQGSMAWAFEEMGMILSRDRKGDNKIVRQILSELVSQAHKNLPKK
jgi:hypothetical protein